MDADYCKAWAKANAGRRAAVIRGRFMGRAGQILGHVQAGCVVFWWTAKDCEAWDDPENFGFADGLPAIEPVKIDGEWEVPVLNKKLVKCAKHHTLRDPSEEPCWSCEKRLPAVYSTEAPWANIKPAPVASPAVDLHPAATRALTFLADLVPLPGWSKETERELLACVRDLKAALRGGGK